MEQIFVEIFQSLQIKAHIYHTCTFVNIKKGKLIFVDILNGKNSVRVWLISAQSWNLIIKFSIIKKKRKKEKKNKGKKKYSNPLNHTRWKPLKHIIKTYEFYEQGCLD